MRILSSVATVLLATLKPTCSVLFALAKGADAICEALKTSLGPRIACACAITVHRFIFSPIITAISVFAYCCERVRLLHFRRTGRQGFLQNHIADVSTYKVGAKRHIDPLTGLTAFIEPPAWTRLVRLDRLIGYGYDQLVDENAALAPLLWFGNHERSPAHPYVAELLQAWWHSRGQPSPIRILDIGSGSCSSLVAISKVIPAKAILFGCDFNPRILLLGMRRLLNANIDAELCLCDASELQYRDASFDIVVNFGCLMQLPDIPCALSEMLRVVRPGGMCICRDEAKNKATLPLLRDIWLQHITGHRPPPEVAPPGGGDFRVEFINDVNFVLSFVRC